ncbi:phage tail assembly chaperone G [Bacillus subtilis]|uniref:phage tail assembly chaperone G n=1 Tax=Bacillus subtilis TaxID=1423 RepID=UPI0011CA18C7|nr:hypothetical protein [Bacillus subtilis]TXK63730.1 hypothetical protein FVD40_05135 [Bacillus subtilis]HEQ3553590.1 hypothetical protein [Enterococcus faecalis]
MQITLRVKGENQTFTNTFIPGRMLREAIQLSKETNFNELSEESLDSLVDYVVRVFDNQFSRDTFYDGIAAPEMIETISNVIQGVVGTATVKKAQEESAEGQSADVVELEKN